MPTHVWTVLCAKMVTDASSNNVSLIDVTEQLNLTPQKPLDGVALIPIQLSLVSLWARDDRGRSEAGKARITHHDVDGTTRGRWEVEVDLIDKRRRRVILQLGSIPVSAPGVQNFQVERRGQDDQWEIVARIPLEIEIEATKVVASASAQPSSVKGGSSQ